VLAAVAVPDKVTPEAVFDALLAMPIEPLKLPVDVGANRTFRLAD